MSTVRHPEALAHATIGPPMRPYPSEFDILVVNGLLKVSLRATTRHSSCLWKLDDLHEALALQVLREKRDRIRCQMVLCGELKEDYRIPELKTQLYELNDALEAIGNRRDDAAKAAKSREDTLGETQI